ncbi:hypothetical protein PSPO01_12170 [Paraphaeosphaeria sporulosa]
MARPLRMNVTDESHSRTCKIRKVNYFLPRPAHWRRARPSRHGQRQRWAALITLAAVKLLPKQDGVGSPSIGWWWRRGGVCRCAMPSHSVSFQTSCAVACSRRADARSSPGSGAFAACRRRTGCWAEHGGCQGSIARRHMHIPSTREVSQETSLRAHAKRRPARNVRTTTGACDGERLPGEIGIASQACCALEMHVPQWMEAAPGSFSDVICRVAACPAVLWQTATVATGQRRGPRRSVRGKAGGPWTLLRGDGGERAGSKPNCVHSTWARELSRNLRASCDI